ncbi:MAG: outer membrane protein [Parvicella sp.]|jgi:outer membrane protein
MKSKINSILFGIGIVVITLGFMAAKGSAAKSKVGYINSNDIWQVMPEKKTADLELKEMQDQMVAYLQQQQKSLEQGVLAYQRDSSAMSELQKSETIKGLLAQQESLKTLPEKANQELTAKQEAVYAPIKLKIQTAIDKVALNNGFEYILDQAFGNIVYVKNESDNILTLVKTELGI